MSINTTHKIILAIIQQGIIGAVLGLLIIILSFVLFLKLSSFKIGIVPREDQNQRFLTQESMIPSPANDRDMRTSLHFPEMRDGDIRTPELTESDIAVQTFLDLIFKMPNDSKIVAILNMVNKTISESFDRKARHSKKI